MTTSIFLFMHNSQNRNKYSRNMFLMIRHQKTSTSEFSEYFEDMFICYYMHNYVCSKLKFPTTLPSLVLVSNHHMASPFHQSAITLNTRMHYKYDINE